MKLGNIFARVSWRKSLSIGGETPEATKLFWEHLSVGLITDFSKNNSYEALIIELSQVTQGMFEKVKDYTDRV